MNNYKTFNQYLSNQIYQNIVPLDDFMRQLNNLVDWDDLSFDLHKLANNETGGRPRYHRTLLFKMLFLSFLYDTSDRDTEELCTNNIRCKYFLGLDITENAPDYSTLSKFRCQILETKKLGLDWLENIFKKITSEAQNAGIEFGKVYALDATHTIADVNTYKDNKRQDKHNRPPRDKDAKWGAKGTEKKLTKEGKQVETVKYFYGYKSHILAEDKYGLISRLCVSPGNIADIDAGEDLVINKLNKKEKEKIKFLTADKAYGSGVLIGILEKDHKIQTAFCLNDQFFKGEFKEAWEKYRDNPEKVKAKKKRYIVERVNADLKNKHSLRRCRYLGITKYQFQAAMSAIVHNLKFATRIMTGATFRPT